MKSIKPGERYVYKLFNCPVTVTAVTEHDIEARFDYGDGKCWVSIPRDKAAHSLGEYTPSQE